MPEDPLDHHPEGGDAGEHDHDLPDGVVLDEQRRDQPPPLPGGDQVRVAPEGQPHLRERELEHGQHRRHGQDRHGGDRPAPGRALAVARCRGAHQRSRRIKASANRE
jgi:hypothetical protein